MTGSQMNQTEPEVGAARDAQREMVRCTNIVKRFGSDEVLHGVNLSVKRGELYGLIGASGSGKSTLLRCVNFMEVPTSGTVEVDSELIGFTSVDGKMKRRSERQLDQQRAEIGMVFQAYNLWPHMNVLQNIIEAPMRVKKMSKSDAEELAMSLLEKVGLADRSLQYPGTLSGGQQQRVAIARALAMQPKVLLLDEVTSALDPELVGEVLQTIRLLAQEGITMIIVSHEMRFMREVADRVAFLDKGRICEEGPASEILSNPSDPRTREFLSRVLD